MPTARFHPAARSATKLGKGLAKTGAAGVALYGATEIISNEISDPGKTIRDLKHGRVDVKMELSEVAAIGAAAAAGGFLPGLAAYGAVQIIDQEIKDPGKTLRDIGQGIETVGRGTEKAVQNVGKGLQDVGRGTEKVVQNVGQGIGDAANEVGKFVGGIFKKKNR